MLLIPCPVCNMARPEREFRYAGEAGLVRPHDPGAASDQDWTDYLFARANRKGVHEERWRHLHGCGRFLVVTRDTVNDRVLQSVPA
ncbi:MAG: soxD [Hyphomicrobiales bacterium]|nr:soxD [Hyphomicrobiales bacterium]